MGFLDHSTNNIIVDAVLTDRGRRALSRNDGSFSIAKFCLGDDEIDYTLIKQYGRTVGKEKVEKNTPILEAQTHGNLALRYKLNSANNPFLTHLPIISLTSPSETPPTLSLSRTQSSVGSNTPNNASITANLQMDQGGAIPARLRDSFVNVEVNNLFLRLSGNQPDFSYSDNTAVYRVQTTSNSSGGLAITFPVSVKSFSDSIFNTYSTTVGGSTVVRTFITLVGVSSGTTQVIEVQIASV